MVNRLERQFSSDSNKGCSGLFLSDARFLALAFILLPAKEYVIFHICMKDLKYNFFKNKMNMEISNLNLLKHIQLETCNLEQIPKRIAFFS